MTYQIISAAEAQGLSTNHKLEEDLRALDTLIRETTAEGGKRCFVPEELICRTPFQTKFRTVGVEKALKAAGYQVVCHYKHDGTGELTFVIKWGDLE